jgi:hypothetical protein
MFSTRSFSVGKLQFIDRERCGCADPAIWILPQCSQLGGGDGCRLAEL